MLKVSSCIDSTIIFSFLFLFFPFQFIIAKQLFVLMVGDKILLYRYQACWLHQRWYDMEVKEVRLVLLFRYGFLTDEYKFKQTIWTARVFSFVQGMLLGLLLFPVAYKYILWIWECSLNTAYSQSRTRNDICRSIIFLVSLGFTMTMIIPSWMQFVKDFHMHPLLWYLSLLS